MKYTIKQQDKFKYLEEGEASHYYCFMDYLEH